MDPKRQMEYHKRQEEIIRSNMSRIEKYNAQMELFREMAKEREQEKRQFLQEKKEQNQLKKAEKLTEKEITKQVEKKLNDYFKNIINKK